MKVEHAIAASESGVAERIGGRRDAIIYAARVGAEVRIVKSFTDPTVVRKLRITDHTAADWVPSDFAGEAA